MKKILISALIFIVFGVVLNAQKSCKITYISNEGFLIEQNNKKIVIDGFFDHIDGNWCDSPTDSLINLIKNARVPFKDIDIIAVTHKHRDHFNQAIVAEHLLSNSKAVVICPKQAEDLPVKHPHYHKFKDRIIEITPDILNDIDTVVSGIKIRVMRLEHSHYPEKDHKTGNTVNRHRNIENLGFLFDIEGTKIFHCGDTNPLNEKEYSKYALNKESIDIAFLERIFFSKGKVGTDMINNHIAPENIIVMHINPKNKMLFSDHFKEVENITVFNDLTETKIYEIKDKD